MKKLILLVALVLVSFLACGDDPIGNWGYSPPDSVLVIPLGEDCYVQNECLVEVYRDCENLCSTIYFYEYSEDLLQWVVGNFDAGNYDRLDSSECGGWQYCWEQLDEGIWVSAVGNIIVEQRMSRYYQCPELSGTVEVIDCPAF